VQSRASCLNFINSQGPNQILSNFLQIQHLEPSMISNSNSIPNFETFQSGKLILVYFPSNPYFIWNFLSKGRPFFDRIDLIPFEKFLNKSTRILFLWAGPKATGPSPPPPRPSRPFPSHIPAHKDLPGHATRQPPPPPHLRPTGVRPPPLAKSLPGPPPLPRCPLRVVH
jgi:hypothetical protein